MTTRPQPGGIERDLDVLRTINAERATHLGVGTLVVEAGRGQVGDELRVLEVGGRSAERGEPLAHVLRGWRWRVVSSAARGDRARTSPGRASRRPSPRRRRAVGWNATTGMPRAPQRGTSRASDRPGDLTHRGRRPSGARRPRTADIGALTRTRSGAHRRRGRRSSSSGPRRRRSARRRSRPARRRQGSRADARSASAGQSPLGSRPGRTRCAGRCRAGPRRSTSAPPATLAVEVVERHGHVPRRRPPLRQHAAASEPGRPPRGAHRAARSRAGDATSRPLAGARGRGRGGPSPARRPTLLPSGDSGSRLRAAPCPAAASARSIAAHDRPGRRAHQEVGTAGVPAELGGRARSAHRRGTHPPSPRPRARGRRRAWRQSRSRDESDVAPVGSLPP